MSRCESVDCRPERQYLRVDLMGYGPLGQHTSKVLSEWLGLHADQIDELGKDKIIQLRRALIIKNSPFRA